MIALPGGLDCALQPAQAHLRVGGLCVAGPNNGRKSAPTDTCACMHCCCQRPSSELCNAFALLLPDVALPAGASGPAMVITVSYSGGWSAWLLVGLCCVQVLFGQHLHRTAQCAAAEGSNNTTLPYPDLFRPGAVYGKLNCVPQHSTASSMPCCFWWLVLCWVPSP